MTRFWCALVLILVSVRPIPAVVVDGIAAVVNGRVITRSEVRALAAFKERTGQAAGPAEARRSALEDLIERTLVQAEAERLGVQVTDEDVERAIREIGRRNGLDPGAVVQALEAQGVSYDEYVEELRAQIRRMKLAGRVLRQRMEVSDEDLREYYLKNVASFREPDAVRLYHLQTSERAAAEAARRRVLSGEDFREVAREVSTGPAARDGGDMGLVPLQNLTPAVRDAVEGLEPGQVSGVVAIRGAYHVFYVAERRRGRVPSFEEVRDRIRERYLEDRQEELYRAWLDSLREKARIEIKWDGAES